MAEVTVTTCPNCGAPVDPREFVNVDDPKCSYCDHPLPVAPPAPAAPVAPRITVPVPAATPSRGCGPAVGIVGGLIAVVVVIVVIVAVSSSSNKVKSLLGGGYRPDGTPVAVPNSTDIYTLARPAGGGSESLRRVDPLRKKVVWSGPTIPPTDEGTPTVVASGSQVFTISGPTVVALDSTTGKQQWQASLSNGLASPCTPSCAFVVGGRLTALSKDGVVQGVAAATGAQAWSKRLNSTPRWLRATPTALLVLDDAASPGSGKVLEVLDPGTGAARQIAPSCAPNPNGVDEAAVPTDEDDFVVSPDGTTLTVVIADVDGCVAHYRIPDGAPLWVTPPIGDNSPVPSSMTGESVSGDASAVLWTNDEGAAVTVYAADVATGAIRSIFRATRSEVTIDGIVGNTAVLEVAPSYDSNKPAVVGVDLASGKQRWQLATRVVKSGDSQAVDAAAPTPVVESCNASADTCTFEAVDPVLGTVRGASTVSASPGSTDEVSATATQGTLVAAVGWEHIVGFDPATAAVKWKWPG